MRLKKEERQKKENLRRGILFKREILDWLSWKCKKLNITVDDYINKFFWTFYENDKDEMINDSINVDEIIKNEIEKMGGLRNVK